MACLIRYDKKFLFSWMTLGATSRHDLLTGGAPPTHHGAPPGPMMLQFIKYLLSISVGSHVKLYCY